MAQPPSRRTGFRIPALLGGAAAACAVVLATTSCAGLDRPRTPTHASFAEYRQGALSLLERQRAFQSTEKTAELEWNAPREWRPANPPTRGVLLVHGLGDSPWSFHDIGEQLAGRGFLVRTVLLPGHGTRPEDMLDVRLEDWRRVVEEQTRLLRAEVGEVYLGGFSTGANLVLTHAYRRDDIAGLLLFSPAFKSDTDYDWVTPWIGWLRPWLREPDGVRPMQNAVRYLTVPTNGFAQFYRSSRAARQALAGTPYGKPVLMVVAEHDSVLDTAYLAQTFSTRFTHPDSRLVWYGSAPAQVADDPRILVRSDHLPELRISQFSHMGLMFSADNPLYGATGSLRLCWNGQETADTAACEQGAPVWFSDWGYREPDKIHARLTFNPHFAWQGAVMERVLNGSGQPPMLAAVPSAQPGH
ncbi:alpha/beta fold hydrolase [Pseudothauera nasutitermitis]|uniref:Alpha/beta fold hydrolase n=1 Tax=Pseudothauera nasutitermitis TaxID=2565930 RepID=A0A4V3WBB7_9RHOO|nr:alpha/beta fold hydrolase [Pseudothauera nasutitermitis]THF62397.1 alpha/beta fold hydrolase [Pseudothauera nasutitermitis]